MAISLLFPSVILEGVLRGKDDRRISEWGKQLAWISLVELIIMVNDIKNVTPPGFPLEFIPYLIRNGNDKYKNKSPLSPGGEGATGSGNIN
jgi:hypothetical protein